MMRRVADLYELPRSNRPCPEWCELTPGHPYSSVLDDGTLERSHGRTFGAGPLSVEVLVDERLSADEETTTTPATLSAPYFGVSLDGEYSFEDLHAVSTNLNAAMSFYQQTLADR